MRHRGALGVLRLAMLWLGISAVIGGVIPSQAYAAITDNRGAYTACGSSLNRSRQYFQNTCGTSIVDADGSIGFVFPTRFVGGVWVDAMDGVNDKATLKQYLRDNYNSANGRLHASAAFVYHTMLGRDGNQANANGGRTVSAADRAEVEQRIDNPLVTYNASVSGSTRYNSAASNSNDDFFVDRGVTLTADMFILYYNGSPVYKLKRHCGNPIDAPAGLPASINWTSTARSTVSSATAIPGSIVTFEHYVKNNGPDSATIGWASFETDAGKTYETRIDFGSGTTYTSGQEKNVDTQNFTIPPGATAGQRFCQMVGWNPTNSSGGTHGRGVPACVTVVYNYELMPQVIPPTAFLPPGGSASVTYSVFNPAPNTKTFPTTMSTRTIVIEAGYTPPVGFMNSRTGNITCSTYTAVSANISCTDDGTLGTPQVFPPGNVTVDVGVGTLSVGTRPAGTRVCRVLTVVSYDESQSATSKRDSMLACTTISRAPYMAVAGGDAWSGGKIATTGCTDSNPYGFKGAATSALGFGSFGEYGLLSTKQITNFASAGKLTGDSLTFANTPAANMGSYTSEHCITDYAARVATRYNVTGTGTSPATLIPGGSAFTIANAPPAVYYATSNITLASKTGMNSQVIIYAAGYTVTINGNLTYKTTGINTFKDAPSLIIIADRIKINAAVTQVDGILFAKTALTTCGEAGFKDTGVNAGAISDDLVAGVCKANQLLINGAVIAGELTVARTKGGSTSADKPAEVFLLRPEAFLTPYANGAADDTVLVTKLEYEMPPRY